MWSQLPAIAALLCVSLSGCSTSVAGSAAPAQRAPLTTADGLPALLLSASDIGAVMSSNDMAVIRDVDKIWNDSARLDDVNCLAIAGAGQQAVYATTGWTATHSQVLREPPTSSSWSHYAVQSVALFPTSQAATDFYETSRINWAKCSNRELRYPQPLGPEQVWLVGQISTEHDVLAVSRIEQAPERWACQRALTVRSNVAVDVEACSLDGAPTAAAAIASQITNRMPAA